MLVCGFLLIPCIEVLLDPVFDLGLVPLPDQTVQLRKTLEASGRLEKHDLHGANSVVIDTSGEIDAKRDFVYVAKGFVNPREQLSTPKLVPGAARAGCPELPRHFTWQKARAQVQHFVLRNAEDTLESPIRWCGCLA